MNGQTLAVFDSQTWTSDFERYIDQRFAGETSVSPNLDYNLYNILDATTLGLRPFLLDEAIDDKKPNYGISHYMDHGVYMFSDTCHQSGTNLYTCFDHCNEQTQMFSSIPAQHNCAVALYVTNAGNVRKGSTSLPAVYYKEGQSTPIEVQIPPESEFLPIAQNFMDCLVSGCKSLPPCNYNQFVNKSLDDVGQDLVDTLCRATPSRVDPDLGGIGVYRSYWIQASLLLLILAVYLLCALIKLLGWLLTHSNTNSCYKGKLFSVAQKRLSRLAGFLTEFHKAQCFFVLATDIAIIVARQRGGSNFSSLHQLYLDHVVSGTMAVNGAITISFGVLLLHIQRMVSWYLLTLSYMGVSVSLAAFQSVSRLTATPQEHFRILDQFASAGPTECGGSRPWALCASPGLYPKGKISKIIKPLRAFEYKRFAFCIVVMIRITASKLMHSNLPQRESDLEKHKTASPHRQHRFLSHQTQWLTSKILHASNTIVQKIWSHLILPPLRYTLGNRIDPLQSYIIKVGQLNALLSVTMILVDVLFLALYVHRMIDLMMTLYSMALSGIGDTGWSIGQVVAITIWIPPIMEWIHLEIRGIKAGSAYRLLPPYRVIKGDLATTQEGENPPAESASGEDKVSALGENAPEKDAGIAKDAQARVEDRDSRSGASNLSTEVSHV